MLRQATKFAPHWAEFEQAYQAGFRHAELWLDAQLLDEHARWLPFAQHFPFTYVPHFPTTGPVPASVLPHLVTVCRTLQTRVVVIHQPQFEQHAQALFELAPELQLAIENHRLSPARFTDWLERSPGLTLDVEHFWKFTQSDAPLTDVLAAVRAQVTPYLHKLRHVHLPGYVAGGPEHQPEYRSRDFVWGVWSWLAENQFQGLIVSEVEQQGQNPFELRMDALLFDRWRQLHDPQVPRV